ncbi:MAG: uroporphyrinogen-III synthase [Ilumatobacter sp.]|uniref:uroporphyrinogen-III synthase n=1 Tax=Ilumatobacter sp. TaxID=1967498 RepID=UPI0032982226
MSPAPLRGTPSGALAGCTVVVTREHVGELGRLLEAAGATVEHVPLIEIVDVEGPRRQQLDEAIAERPDWVIVTSAAGADRVAAARRFPDVRLAAVGTATAERLARVAGRSVDLVPRRQIAASLVEAFAVSVDGPQSVVIAQSDIAGDVLATGLAAAGHDVDVHTAYRTVVRRPDDMDRMRLAESDAVVFASGSAARSWADALGDEAAGLLPDIVVAIGPTTRAVAEESGLKVTHEAAEHSLAGIIEELTEAWRDRVGR